ncbi:MAG: sodium/solute symporter [Chloroflexi bacterium]|jgi:solute:Na+ symporter, SSS family|nr:sodium/solute symporter [Chloroflexota bacterium]
MRMATGIDLYIVVIYMVLMVVIGIIVSRFNKSDSDFFKSGNKMPWWLSGLSFFMTSFSVYTFTGAAGLAYRAPSVALVLYLCNAVALVPAVLFLAAKWRRSRAMTSMSYLSERYDVPTNQLYSWSHLGVAVVQGGVQLLALGKFISVAMGTPLGLTILVCGIVIAVYCLIGGLWAVVITDSLQFMVLFPCALVVLFLSFHELGDVGRLVSQAPPDFWKIETQEFDWWYILAYLVMIFFAMSSGAPAQRFFSVKDEKEAKKVAILSMVLLLIAPLIWLTPPIVTRILDLDLSSVTTGLNAPQEAAYVVFCMKFLPAGAMGIMLSAMLAATMSSISSTFNVYAAVITEDIIKQVFWKNAKAGTLLLIGRVVTVVLAVLVIAAAIMQSRIDGGVFEIMMTISGIVVVPAGVPIVMGLLVKRTPRWAALASYGTGLVIGAAVLLLGKDISFTQEVFWVGGLSSLVYFIPGLIIKARGNYKVALDKFFVKMETAVSRSESGESDRTDRSSLKITGWTTAGMGLAIMALFMLDLDLKGKLINLSIGFMIFLVGVLLLLATAHLDKKTNNGI